MKTKFLLLSFVFSTRLFASEAETEPNDGPSTSDPLTTNVTIVGQLSSFKDQDWFVIETSTADVINLSFQHERIGYQYNQWKVSSYNDEELLLSQQQIYAPDEDTTITVGVPEAGIYFIVVSAGNGSGSQFDIHLTDPYSLIASFSNAPPHKDNPPTTENCRATFQNGILQIPCIDVPDAFDGVSTYEADLELAPFSDPFTFELIEAHPK